MAVWVFLGGLAGLLAALASGWIGLAILPFLGLLAYRKAKGRILGLLLAFSVGLILGFLLPEGIDGEAELVGLVVKKRESYVLLATVKGVFYVPAKGEFNLFSLLRGKGKASPLSFYGYEGAFDFRAYLSHRQCFREWHWGSYEVLFPSVNWLGPYREWVLQGLNGDGRAVASGFLFAQGQAELIGYDALASQGISRLLISTGAHVSGLFWLWEKASGKRKGNGVALGAMGLSGVLWVLSSFSFSLGRVFLQAAVNVPWVSGKLRLKDRADQTAAVGIALMALAPSMIQDVAFWLPLALGFLRIPQGIFLAEKRGIGKWAWGIALSFSVSLPLFCVTQGKLSIGQGLASVLLKWPSNLVFLFLLPLLLCPWLGGIVGFLPAGFALALKGLGGLGSLTLGRGSWAWLFVFLPIWIWMGWEWSLGRMERGIKGLLVLPLAVAMVSFTKVLPKSEAVFLYVGQGDATLVLSQGKAVLIDTGGSRYDDIANDCLIPYFKSRGLSRLDAVLITHKDFDHMGALEALSQSFPIGEVVYGEDVDGPFQAGGLSFVDYNERKGQTDENENSGVFGFSIRATSFLIMGDASAAVEAEILGRNPALSADVLKVGHHGSNTSSSLAFLKAVSPKLAVVSCGKNSYGHPHPQVLERLESLEIPYWRTDRSGTLTYRC